MGSNPTLSVLLRPFAEQDLRWGFAECIGTSQQDAKTGKGALRVDRAGGGHGIVVAGLVRATFAGRSRLAPSIPGH